MRLIDVDALVKDIEDYQKSMVFHSYAERMHFDDMIDFAVDHLEEAHTIDAVPVVHAKWIMNHFGAKCSHCLRLYCMEPSWSEKIKHMPPTWIYCPNCGAKMDGDPDG